MHKTIIGGIMKLLGPALMACALAASLTGCTYPDPALEAGNQHADSPPPSPPATSITPMTLEGQFQSQGAVTRGSAIIRVSETGAVLQLQELSTGPGEDLRIMLSPGTLSPNAQGELGLTSSTFIELGPLTGTPNQRIDIGAKRWSMMWEPVRSVVIYNYAERTAYGTANLADLQSVAD